MNSAASDRAILDIIEQVYAASCNPELWAPVAARCQGLFPGVSFSFFIKFGDSYDALSTSAGWDPYWIRRYLEHYHKINPYYDVLRHTPPGQVVRASELVTRRWLEGQEFFHDWLKPAGDYTHGSGITLARSAASLARLSYDIPERMADLEGATAEALRRIGPHFGRALEITSRLGGATAAETAFAALIEHIADCAIAVDRNRRIQFANRQALALLKERRIVKDTLSSGLVFVAHEAQEVFAQALQGCLGVVERPSSGSFMVRVGEHERRPVHVLPLRVSRGIAAGAASPLALVLIGTHRSSAMPPSDLLRAAYGLSHREAAVALHIANGASVREAADQLGVSYPTARNQLGAGMAKLGIHRRAELVALLAGLLPRFRLAPPRRRD